MSKFLVDNTTQPSTNGEERKIWSTYKKTDNEIPSSRRTPPLALHLDSLTYLPLFDNCPWRMNASP